jgi:hypothetical protein
MHAINVNLDSKQTIGKNCEDDYLDKRTTSSELFAKAFILLFNQKTMAKYRKKIHQCSDLSCISASRPRKRALASPASQQMPSTKTISSMSFRSGFLITPLFF